MLLAGDIGGTKTALALYESQTGPRHSLQQATYPSQDYVSLEAIVSEFLQQRGVMQGWSISHAAFGVAGPVVKGRAEITNLPWVIDRQRLMSAFSLQDVHLLNDLEAVATAVPILVDEDVVVLNSGTADPRGAIAVVAPGTGLGEGFLVWDGQGYRAFPCEGGHTDFAPVGEVQRALLAYLQERLDHVSFERVCSGIGIPNIYAFLRDSGRYEEPSQFAARLDQVRDLTPLIVSAAQNEELPICVATLELFIDILGREAGNLALKTLATGGVFLGGGIPPRILPYLQRDSFLEAFLSKGRFRSFLSRIPVKVITRQDTAILGVAYDGLRMMHSQAHDKQRST
jgi:glucokinase